MRMQQNDVKILIKTSETMTKKAVPVNTEKGPKVHPAGAPKRLTRGKKTLTLPLPAAARRRAGAPERLEPVETG